ncbi:hypothetical protein GWI33_018169 [Rhynchophorus ferrugineus]|uniref:G kinase-anchoring protein 1-like protein n=1 Tax=Rhynchophorus ferrugineus TaxID=354439 RepID=A0A834HX66_RHYFE|nr:hypothetical protein GWI33_018169 [Rhynchophorus ferrugineus]
MDIAVPSRFACLKIEDDDFRPSNTENKKKVNKVSNKKPNSAAKEASKGSWTTTRKKGNTNEKPKAAPKQSQKKKKQLQKGESSKDWEEWQKKDAEFINDVFEQQMQNAILQSKLEFEQQKKISSKESPQSQGKKKKPKTMTWNQFVESRDSDTREEVTVVEHDKDFFDDVVETVRNEIKKDVVEENRKQRQEKFDEVFSLTQLQEKLEEERQKNALLENQLKEAKSEIAAVKKRNAMLCSMLSQGEMKNKAQVLSEMARLSKLKEEMIDNITQLKGDLEKERTKSAEMKKQNKTIPKQPAKKMPKKKSK